MLQIEKAKSPLAVTRAFVTSFFSSTGNAKDDRNLLKPNSKLKIPVLIYNSSLDFLDFFFFPAEGNLNVLVASRWRYSTNESTSLAPEYFSGLSLLFMGAK